MRCIARTTLAARSLSRLAVAAVVAGMLLFGTSAGHTKQTPEQKCQKGRYDAAAKYTACQQKAAGAFYGGGKFEKFAEAIGKCTVKYMATWPKLQKKATGTGAACNAARFADNVTTITDNLTGLDWEKKTDDAIIHDKDNQYTWRSADADSADADGTAFPIFLPALNSGWCPCDWRLPTISELQTILVKPYPCDASPCIDPVFGPTMASLYWSSTSFPSNPFVAWYVNFLSGFVSNDLEKTAAYVRAVRGGP